MVSLPTNIYWLGGSPCSGKSSVAERLCETYGMTYYKGDDYFGEHLERGHARGNPWATRLRHATSEFIFMRSLEENLDLSFSIFREEFPFVIEDIRSLPKPILIEGCVALPESLASLNILKRNAFYMVPTEEFQRAHYAKRLWAPERVADTSDPTQALENWMRRDVVFARQVAAAAESLEYPVVWVDGSLSIEETVNRVARHFDLKK